MIKWLKTIVVLAGLPRKWQLTIYILCGIVLGLAIIVTRISNAFSYISDSPSACINCHVMTDAYASWQKGSHGQIAACIDCHIPHDNPVAGLAFKASDGLKHSYVFTMRTEPQVLKLSKAATPVIEINCVRCHYNQLEMIKLEKTAQRKCWDCHNNIHELVISLSSSPAQLRPALPKSGINFQKGIK